MLLHNADIDKDKYEDDLQFQILNGTQTDETMSLLSKNKDVISSLQKSILSCSDSPTTIMGFNELVESMSSSTMYVYILCKTFE